MLKQRPITSSSSKDIKLASKVILTSTQRDLIQPCSHTFRVESQLLDRSGIDPSTDPAWTNFLMRRGMKSSDSCWRSKEKTLLETTYQSVTETKAKRTEFVQESNKVMIQDTTNQASQSRSKIWSIETKRWNWLEVWTCHPWTDDIKGRFLWMQRSDGLCFNNYNYLNTIPSFIIIIILYGIYHWILACFEKTW